MPALAYWTTAALLALSALALLAWSLVADRARGRARCPRCWYELAGLAPGAAADTPPRCPECGHEPRHHRRLYRTRRRWRWAALAILLLAGAAALASYPHARAGGWQQLLPSAAVIGATHFTDEEWPYWELARRIRGSDNELWTNAGSLSDWQWRWATDRCASVMVRGEAPQATREAAMQFLFYYSPVPRRAADAIANTIFDQNPRLAFIATSGAKSIRFDLHPVPAELRAALERAAAKESGVSGDSTASLALRAFDAIPPDWRRPTPRYPPPTPDEVVQRLRGASTINLVTVHGELGVRSGAMITPYDGESGPFGVSTIDIEIDGHPGEDRIILISDILSAHWHALIYLRRGDTWTFGGWLDLGNNDRRPPLFTSLSAGSATYLVVKRLTGHSTDGSYLLYIDHWLSFASGRPRTMLGLLTYGRNIIAGRPHHWILDTEPPTLSHTARGLTAEYLAEVEITPGKELWERANPGIAPEPLFTITRTMPFVTACPSRPFSAAAPSGSTAAETLLNPETLHTTLFDQGEEFIALYLHDFLSLARTASPHMRNYLRALADRSSATPEVLQLREALDEADRKR